VLALLRGEAGAGATGKTLGFFVAAVVLLFGFAAAELTQKAPMFEFGSSRSQHGSHSGYSCRQSGRRIRRYALRPVYDLG